MAHRFWLFLLLSPACLAAEWPQWRGPARDGVVHEVQIPANLPESLRQRWKVAVGEGHSSPILAGGALFVFSRQQGREILRRIDPGAGKIAWEQSYPAPYKMNHAAVRHGEGPKSTPVFSAGRVYTFGISGILSCFDAASGKRLWQKEFSRESARTSPLYGVAMSPVVEGGVLIVHVGGPDRGAVLALEAASGAEKWRWNGDAPGYSSPEVVELAGVRQVMTQGRSKAFSLDAATGALLWEVPYTTAYDQNSVSPVVYQGLVILSGVHNGIVAVRPQREGTAWSVPEAWKVTDVSLYMSTPVRRGPVLYGLSHKNRGQFFALDIRSGKVLWTSEPRQGDNAAILLAGETLWLLRDDAELIVARAGTEAFQPLRRYSVAGSPTWAHPLLTADGVVVKDKDSLALWSWR
ncbi:MAG: PQQ-like beta-propeller repeat protein [Bryobacterales bacterium]|nr:PQQ-like beta-propeller repeat protein [Bryobacterales bacterium]